MDTDNPSNTASHSDDGQDNEEDPALVSLETMEGDGDDRQYEKRKVERDLNDVENLPRVSHCWGIIYEKRGFSSRSGSVGWE